MHPYAAELSERRPVFAILAGLSLLCAYALPQGLRALQIGVPWWIDAPSVMGFYAIFYRIFDTWLWNKAPIRRIGLVKLPNVDGSWEGYLTTSYDKHSQQHAATLDISQSWTQIQLTLRTSTSESCSQTASIVTESPARAYLISYEYLNEPKAHAKAAMHSHRGTARLTLSSKQGKEVLSGGYYTGRGRQNYGSLDFERQRPK